MKRKKITGRIDFYQRRLDNTVVQTNYTHLLGKGVFTDQPFTS